MILSPTMKYGLNQRVWFMNENKICAAQIDKISIRASGDEDYAVSYMVYGSIEWYKENELFENKQQLVESLLKG